MVFEALHQIVRGRPDLHEVGDVPRAAQRDGFLAEQEVDVGRDERLAVAADVLLLDEPNDRRVLLCERPLVREVGGRVRRRDQGGKHQDGQESEARADHDENSLVRRGRRRAITPRRFRAIDALVRVA